MLNRFEKLIVLLLDNLFDFATIIIAGTLVIRYQITSPTQNDLPEITTWILAVLAIMAVSGIWERNRSLRRIEKVGQETREFAKQYVDDAIPASRFFINQKLHQLPDTVFSSAQTIDIGGIVLGRTIRECMNVFQERVQAGANLRIMICDPKNNAVIDQVALRLEGELPPTYWRERLEGVQLYASEIAKTPHKPGSIQIGYLPYIPAFGLINIDTQKPQGLCYIEMYHHKSPESGPGFMIQKANDPTWHQFFAKQFEILWESCRTESL